MDNMSKVVVTIAVVILIAIGVWLVLGSQQNNQPEPTPPPTTNNQQNNADREERGTTTIVYSDAGFNPSTLTVTSGDTVKVTNQSDKSIEFASSPHPTHANNPELNIGEIGPGESKTFTATTKGAWNYHNHFEPEKTGLLTVE